MDPHRILYEDNHMIAVNKAAGELVQGDKSGDQPLCETIKAYLKEKYRKPGNVFCGVIHRIDRPVSGVLLFATTTCPNCKIACAALDKAGVHYTKILADKQPDLAKQYGIRQSPTLVVKDGGSLSKLVGVAEIKKYLTA